MRRLTVVPKNNRYLCLEKGGTMYIHEHQNWYRFRYRSEEFLSLLTQVRSRQGNLLGRMASFGFSLREEAMLTTLTLDVLKSSEIEGEMLDGNEVRSSLARRLGIETAGLVSSSRNVDGIVDMMLDATRNFNEPLTDERLWGWHAALFPMGWSGMYRIEVGRYRTGEMQVISGAMGRERIHYEAPRPERVGQEMAAFLEWFNGDAPALDEVLKSAIAHFWFVTIHPFDDGNGRIARAITDMLLSRSDATEQRFYSMSNQILADRKGYYAALERAQRGDGDITEWIRWYLECLLQALQATEMTLERVLAKARFWETHRNVPLNERQQTMLAKLLDGFEGKLTSSKWAKITKCSPDTALRDIGDLVEKGILQKAEESGRSTNYKLVTELYRKD